MSCRDLSPYRGVRADRPRSPRRDALLRSLGRIAEGVFNGFGPFALICAITIIGHDLGFW